MMLSWLAEFFFKIGVALGFFAAGANEEKRRQAIKQAKEAYDEAEKWANRPVNCDDTVKRLRELARRETD